MKNKKLKPTEQFIKDLYDALIQAGFSKKDALYIVTTQGITIGGINEQRKSE